MKITLSTEAATRLNEEEGERVLRIAFTTGCGGSGYRLSYVTEPAEDDHVLEVDGVTIALDGMAASKLDGAVIELDPAEDGFVLEHPDAVTAVWCG